MGSRPFRPDSAVSACSTAPRSMMDRVVRLLSIHVRSTYRTAATVWSWSWIRPSGSDAG